MYCKSEKKYSYDCSDEKLIPAMDTAKSVSASVK